MGTKGNVRALGAMGLVGFMALGGAAPPEQATDEPATTATKAAGPSPTSSWFQTQMAIEAGGGYASFGAKSLRDITQNGGAWDIRLVLGAHAPIGIELAYVGTANQLNGHMAAVDPSAVILSNAFEADLRFSTPALRRI